MISGILRPNSGTVKIEDVDIWSLPTNELPSSAFAQDRLRVSGLPPVPAPDDGGECGHSADPAAAEIGTRRSQEGLKDLEIVGLKSRATCRRSS
jgi:hypothetical protein